MSAVLFMLIRSLPPSSSSLPSGSTLDELLFQFHEELELLLEEDDDPPNAGWFVKSGAYGLILPSGCLNHAFSPGGGKPKGLSSLS